MIFIDVGELPSDPMENRDQHCKIYVESSIKKAIEKFQVVNEIDSFSEAGRELLIFAFQRMAKAKASREPLIDIDF